MEKQRRKTQTEVKGAEIGGEEKKRQSQFWQRDPCVSLPRDWADLDSKLLLISCVTLGVLLNFSELFFFLCKIGNNISAHRVVVMNK